MSLKIKTIVGVAFIEAVLLLFLVTMTVNYLRETNYEGLEKRALTTVKLFASASKDAVLSYDLATLDSLINEVMRNPDIVYARVLDGRGRILSEAGKPSVLARHFVADANVVDVADDVFDSTEDITEDGVSFGRVELGLDIQSLNEKIREVRQWTQFVALLEMLLVAFFSYVLGTYLTSQLRELNDSAKAIASGDLNVSVRVKSGDEVGQLASSFNTMVAQLRAVQLRREEAERELRELNLSLEMRVKDRTRALQHKNRELLEANKEIKQAQSRLLQSEKMASLGVLAAGVAHEINNPIGFISSNVATLTEYVDTLINLVERYQQLASSDVESRVQLEKEIATYLARDDLSFIIEDTPVLLEETGKGLIRVRDIVKGLREFSHSDPRQAMVSCDINELIGSTLNIAKSQFKYHADVSLDLQPLPDVLCDKGKIGQVLLNLIINASQALVERGHITVRSRVVEGAVEVDVEDDGVGIPEKDLEKIFDPFYTTKPVGDGTGLGLAICFNIVQEHGGSIEVSSVLGQGTTFTVKIPFERS
ncbi:MAG TPA: ATP-binding protein [Pseudomonadales bacterium]|nr:ATP-binding protein [Pseudomonadales bacterium]